jgi:hypothetical protein
VSEPEVAGADSKGLRVVRDGSRGATEQTLTDAAATSGGEFRFEGLIAGRYALQAPHPGSWGYSEIATFELTADQALDLGPVGMDQR